MEAAADLGAGAAGQMRASLGPVEADARDRPLAFAEVGDVDAERAEPVGSGAGEGEAAVLVEQALTRHRVRDRDSEPPGEVVVAGACTRERVGDRDGAEGARPLLAG